MLTIKTRVLTLLQHMKQKKYQTPKLGITKKSNSNKKKKH